MDCSNILLTSLAFAILGSLSAVQRPVPKFRYVQDDAFIQSIAMSPDETRFVSTGDGGPAMWDYPGGRLLFRFGQMQEQRVVAHFSPDGLRVVLESFHEGMSLWDARTGRLVRRFLEFRDDLPGIAFLPDASQFIVGSSDGHIRVFDSRIGRQNASRRSVISELNEIAPTASGAYLLLAGRDELVRVRTKDLKVSHRVRFDEGEAEEIVLSPNGSVFVTLSKNGVVRFWNPRTLQIEHVVPSKSSYMDREGFSTNGSMFGIADGERLRIWSLRPWRLIHDFAGLKASGIVLSLEGNRAVVDTGDRNGILVELTTGRRIATLPNESHLTTVQFVESTKRLLTVAKLGEVKEWDPITGKQLRQIGGHQEFVESASYLSDGEQIRVVGSDGMDADISARTGKLQVRHGPRDSDGIREITSPNGRLLLHIGWPAEMRDAMTGRVLYGLSDAESAVFSPDSSQLATTADSPVANIRDAKTGNVLHVLDGAKGALSCLSFSNDGRLLAAGSDDSNVYMWDIKNGRLRTRISGHTGTVSAIAFSGDSRMVATGSLDGTVHVWSSESGKRYRVTSELDRPIQSVSFSPRGDRLLATDGTVRIWDIRTGEELYRQILFDDNSWLVLSPTGRYDSSNDTNPRKGYMIADTPTGVRAIGFDYPPLRQHYSSRLIERLSVSSQK